MPCQYISLYVLLDSTMEYPGLFRPGNTKFVFSDVLPLTLLTNRTASEKQRAWGERNLFEVVENILKFIFSLKFSFLIERFIFPHWVFHLSGSITDLFSKRSVLYSFSRYFFFLTWHIRNLTDACFLVWLCFSPTPCHPDYNRIIPRDLQLPTFHVLSCVRSHPLQDPSVYNILRNLAS